MRSLLAFTHPALATAKAAAAGAEEDGEEDDDEDEEFEGGKAMPRGGGNRGGGPSSSSSPSPPSRNSRFATPAAPPPTFASMKELKAALSQKNLSFCDVCLKGRKVFACEQLVYTRRALARHKAAGDAAGPLAESGFSGHPRCDFCSQRFYGETELFVHMQTRHEHCFLCRRARPTEYAYFRDYADLDSHFARSHHRCPHPECLEKKFVVFASDGELRAHALKEHGGNLSKAERRAAADSTSPLRRTPMRVLISSVRYCLSVLSAASSGVPKSRTLAYLDDDGDETLTNRLVSTSSGER